MLVYQSYNDVSKSPNARKPESKFDEVNVFKKPFTSNFAPYVLTRKVYRVTPKFEFDIDWTFPFPIFEIPTAVLCNFVIHFAREFGVQTPFFTFGDDKKIFTATGKCEFGVVFVNPSYKVEFDLNDQNFKVEQEVIVDFRWKIGRTKSWKE